MGWPLLVASSQRPLVGLRQATFGRFEASVAPASHWLPERRTAQDAPKTPQEASKKPLDCPTSRQEALQTFKTLLKRPKTRLNRPGGMREAIRRPSRDGVLNSIRQVFPSPSKADLPKPRFSESERLSSPS